MKYNSNPTEITGMYVKQKTYYFVIEDSGIKTGERYLLQLEPYGNGGLIFGFWSTTQLRITNRLLYTQAGICPIARKEVFAMQTVQYPGVQKLFVNNVKVSDLQVESASVNNTIAWNSLTIGGRYDSNSVWSSWSGTIYEMEITEETSSDEQILARMQQLRTKWAVPNVYRALAYAGAGNKINNLSATNLITDTGSWTFQGMFNISSAYDQAILFHFCGMEIRDTGSGTVYLQPGPSPNVTGYSVAVTSAILSKGNVRFTLTRSGTTFTGYVNGSLYFTKSVPIYIYNNQYYANRGSFQQDAMYDTPSKTWDHIIWDTVRTTTQILNNDITGALHRYSLDSSVNDSIGTANLTTSGTVSYLPI